jgi:hypothetical protein
MKAHLKGYEKVTTNLLLIVRFFCDRDLGADFDQIG